MADPRRSKVPSGEEPDKCEAGNCSNSVEVCLMFYKPKDYVYYCSDCASRKLVEYDKVKKVSI